MLRSFWFTQILFTITVFVGVASARIHERLPTEGFVSLKLDGIPQELRIFVRYYPPKATAANPDPVVFVNLNGLTYTTDSWGEVVDEQLQDGDGVLLFDFLGQGRTLLENSLLNYDMGFDVQTQLLQKLLEPTGALKIPENTRKVLFGVSYGGAITLNYLAKYPQANVEGVAVAPYVRPIDQMDRKIRDQIAILNLNPFFASVPFEDKYRMLLWQDIYLYPWLEPTLLRPPLDLTMRAVHALVYGMRDFSAATFVDKIPKEKLHGVIAGRDQYINDDVKNFFLKTVGVENIASLLLIESSEHKVPEAVPKTQVFWLKLIARQDSRIFFTGRLFEAQTEKGLIQAGSGSVLNSPKEVAKSHLTIWIENFSDALLRWPKTFCYRFLETKPAAN